jgi:hypothetical protein
MRVGVLKIGARISFSSQGTSGATGEALSIIKMLKLGGADITIMTKIIKKDVCPEGYTWVNLTDHLDDHSWTPDVDVLLVINGTPQFYGGVEDPEQLMNYAIINSFKGPVAYAYCDPELTLRQVWSVVERKTWKDHWSREQLFIERDDIRYLSQPNDLSAVKAAFGKNDVRPTNMVHFPFEQFPCLNEMLPINPTPSVDLSYGGTMRGGRRVKKMVKFYFGLEPSISVEMFGKITNDDFDLKYAPATLRRPTFTGPVNYDLMLPKMNEAMSHCVIGDPFYEEINDIPQRLYESIWANVVTFVDQDMDTIRRVYKNDRELADFLYVSDRQELGEKINLLKASPETRAKVLEAQVAAVGFDARRYCESFVAALVG